MSDNRSSAITIAHLTKKFGDFTALHDVSLDIKEGEIFGLLGPNGAGKTTMISILATLNKPTSGSASILGLDVSTQSEAVRKKIGIVFQDPSLDLDLTARENLDFHARLYGISPAEKEAKIDQVMKVVDLSDKADNPVKSFSGGMKRRLEIARSMLHTPRIIFLDEPTLGLDVQTRRKLWEYIRQLSAAHNITVILTTHYLEEADALCDRIAIIDQGEIKALDTPAKLKSKLGGDSVSLDSPQIAQLEKVLKAKKVGKKFTQTNHTLTFTTQDGSKRLPDIINWASAENISITSMTVKQPTLEEVFVQLTGHAIRDEGADMKGNLRQMARMMGRH
jgi:ABC-2 type transport system ATP-binding protein